MPFLTEPTPPRGVATEILPGIRRLVADNPGKMTYHGTNTYLLDGVDGLTVLDPGPKDEVHVRNILAATAGAPVARIVLTHRHSDHYGALPQLRAESRAVVYAYGTAGIGGAGPDVALAEGDTVAGLRAVFTPGHAADHLAFEYIAGGRKLLFSGDHVMSWSSSIVSPPEGDMLAYYRSLDLLLDRDDEVYLPGHGPPLPAPRGLVEELLLHRQKRETAILKGLRRGRMSVARLGETLYGKTDKMLKIAAQRNVLAHLLKLVAEGKVVEHEITAPTPDATEWGHVSYDGLREFALAPAGQ